MVLRLCKSDIVFDFTDVMYRLYVKLSAFLGRLYCQAVAFIFVFLTGGLSISEQSRGLLTFINLLLKAFVQDSYMIIKMLKI